MSLAGVSCFHGLITTKHIEWASTILYIYTYRYYIRTYVYDIYKYDHVQEANLIDKQGKRKKKWGKRERKKDKKGSKWRKKISWPTPCPTPFGNIQYIYVLLAPYPPQPPLVEIDKRKTNTEIADVGKQDDREHNDPEYTYTCLTHRYIDESKQGPRDYVWAGNCDFAWNTCSRHSTIDSAPIILDDPYDKKSSRFTPENLFPDFLLLYTPAICFRTFLFFFLSDFDSCSSRRVLVRRCFLVKIKKIRNACLQSFCVIIVACMNTNKLLFHGGRWASHFIYILRLVFEYT